MTEARQFPISNFQSPIFLVGFMGSGKTTVGRLLAERLGRPFIDLDDRIIERAGKSITHIFAEEGESAFRQLESEVLGEVAQETNVVVSLGGGAFVNEANRRVIKEHGMSVWLDCPLETILQRLEGSIGRPLVQSPEQLRQLLESRLSSYAQADVKIDVSQVGPEKLADIILRTVCR